MTREPVDLSGLVRSVNNSAPDAAGNVTVATGGAPAAVDITGAATNIDLAIGEQAYFDYSIANANEYVDLKINISGVQAYRIELFGDDASDNATHFSTMFLLSNNTNQISVAGMTWETSTPSHDLLSQSYGGMLVGSHRIAYARLDVMLNQTFGQVAFDVKSIGYGSNWRIGYNTTGIGAIGTLTYLGRLVFSGAQIGRGLVTRIA